jgi:RNA polymerase sigma-70 factor (ECF subfamily)
MGDLRDQNYESFLKLYRESENKIFRYILALLPNYAASEDIMQDTMLVMWRKFDQYRAGSSFTAWGMQIARFNVLHYRRKHKSGAVCFDSQTIDNITRHETSKGSDDRAYQEALRRCMERLPDKSRDIVSLRYVENMKVVDIALRMGKTVQAAYKMMSRIHHALLNCIENKLAGGEVA